MRKKINLLILVCLIAVCTCVFVACNTDGSKFVDEVPEIIGDVISDDGNITVVDGGYALLQFEFKELSSVFHSITIDEQSGFDVTTVNYVIAYTKNGTTSVSVAKPLSKDYINADDQKLLYQKGHHTIHVSIPFNNSTIQGSFSLHLRFAYEEANYSTLVFKTNGGTPLFTSAVNGEAKVSVETGSSFTYDEFVRTFPITQDKMAIASYEVTGGSIKSFTKASGAITISEKEVTFKPIWTDNTVTVSFEISIPKDDSGNNATFIDGVTKVPTLNNQYPIQSTGTINRPDIDKLNVFNGFFFAGWYNKANDQLWNFTNPVAQSNIVLYAKYSKRYYSLTIYTMSGDFKSTLDNSTVNGTKLDSVEKAKNAKLLEAKCNVTFNANTSLPITLDIDGLNYNANLSNYFAEVNVDASDSSKTKIIILSDLFSAFEKPVSSENLNGKITADTVMYSQQTCKKTEAVKKTDLIKKNTALYVKWKVDATNDAVLSALYTDVLFKDSIEINSDGSVKLVDIKDESFCELVIPDAIEYNGTTRYVSEIGEKAIMNNRSLGYVDFSKAKHLKRIGSEAFINCLNLHTITWQSESDNNINYVGRSAFTNTLWEDSFEEDSFIVINDILYKYIDGAPLDNPTKSLDLTDAKYDELSGVTMIATNAFRDSINLETIKLLDSIEELSSKAFADLTKLKYVETSSSSNLQRIASDSFEGTALISAAYQDTAEPVNNTKNLRDNDSNPVQAVIVGKVLVRMIDTEVKKLRIKSSDKIVAFAGEAFANCSELSLIDMPGTISSIEYIGANAFASTVKVLQEQTDGYYIINGILAEYYAPTIYFKNAVIPKDVTTVSSYAFNSYARYIETIQIGQNVTLIKDYAFAGDTRLKGILLSDVKTDNSTNPTKLVNLPDFELFAFADKDGKLINDIEFYVLPSALAYLEEIEDGTRECNSEIENKWFNLYLTHKDNFKVERYEKVYVNTNKVPTIYIIDSAGMSSWQTIDEGIILVSTAGVIKYEQFDSTILEDKFNSNETVDAKHKVKLVAKSDWGDATCLDYEYEVKYALKGMTSANNYGFYNKTESTILSKSNLSSSTFWIEGFEGDVLGASVPTFYTTKTTLDLDEIVLHYYTDFGSKEHTIICTSSTEFAPNSHSESTITFKFNFYNAGQYWIKLNYKGVDPKVETITQAEALSLPLNANVSQSLSKAVISFNSEDGNSTLENLVLGDYSIYSVNGDTTQKTFPSNELGLNIISLVYQGSKNVISGVIKLEIVYAIVLEGDETQFEFRAKGANKEAYVYKHKDSSVETLVIPSSCMINGTEYKVVEIGDNVFKGYQNLTTVYLPSTIKKIGNGAFQNCAKLNTVSSSLSSKYVQTTIANTDYQILTKEIALTGQVELDGITDIFSGEITIPEKISYSYVDPTTSIKYSVEATPILGDKLFDKFSGTIYMDYKDEYVKFVKNNLRNVTLNLDNGSHVVIMVKDIAVINKLNELDDGWQFIAYNDQNIAFVESLMNQQDEDGNSIELETNYMFYYVVSDTQARQTSTTSRHFDFVKGEPKVVETKVITQTRKLVKLDSLEDGMSVIVVGDDIETSQEGDVKVTTINTTIEISENITYATTGDFVIYLPDTIFNKCIVKNGLGVAQNVIVYKHGDDILYSTSSNVPSTLEYIGNIAFDGCTNLVTIDLSQTTKLEYIGARAFKDTGLTTIDLSNTIIEDINNQTFQGCASLVSVVLPNTVINIGGHAFDGCEKLTVNKDFFKNITTILTNAFILCNAMTTIDLTEISLDSTIAENAFSINGTTIKVAFTEDNKPSNWDSSWYGICNVSYAD